MNKTCSRECIYFRTRVKNILKKIKVIRKEKLEEKLVFIVYENRNSEKLFSNTKVAWRTSSYMANTNCLADKIFVSQNRCSTFRINPKNLEINPIVCLIEIGIDNRPSRT